MIGIIFYLIFILFCLAGIIIGVILAVKPGMAIEMQRKFYEKINWRLEPISMEKELRNTRLMGMVLAGILTAALVFLGFMC